jgi:UPF0716 protein FxsA
MGEVTVVFILFLIFVIVPIIEISILIQVGEYFGLVPTVALVIFTAAIGASLVRSQGLKTLLSAQQKLQQGQQAGLEVVEGIMLAVAGVLLVTPGFATDAFGLVLLIPFTRKALANYLISRMPVSPLNASFGAQGFRTDQDKSGDIIEGEFVNKDNARIINPSTEQSDLNK